MKKKTKRIITSISAALLLFVYYNYDYKYVPQYEIVCNNKTHCYASYRNGNVYIVKDIKQMKNIDIDENDVIVIDNRNSKDPDYKILCSYLITDKNARNDIIEILCQYEEEHPSKWNRTKESMRVEWFVHNLLHIFNYQTDHTTDVDLNNQDEEKFNNEIYQKLLKI